VALEKLQQDFNSLAATRDEYKTRIDGLEREITDLKESKEKLSQLSESSKVREEKLKSESKSWQTEAEKLNTSTDEYKSRISNLQRQITELTQTKDNQLREIRSQLTEAINSGEKNVAEVTGDFSKRNTTLQNDLKTLQAKIKEQSLTIDNQKSELANQVQIGEQAAAKLKETEKQIADYRNRLHREESESQRLNHQLSEAESVRLTLTERDAELRKTRIELQDAAVSGGPLQAQVDEQKRQNDTLINQLQERDEELARLNAQMTDNRLRSKQQQSNISLLTQEKDTHIELIRSLEKQAENTLELHTKIAQQSTELEDLRARLFERDSSISSTSKAQAKIQAGLQQVETLQSGDRTTGQTSSKSSVDKPRVFVRSDADTEALTGATGYQSAQRPQLTVDGHRIHRADGGAELTLLPGITPTIASALNKYGINAFEQIAHWGDREIAHYAEKVGVPVKRARQYNWPRAANSILSGTYRKDSQKIDN